MSVFLFHSPSEPRNSPPAFILYRVDPITLARKLGCLIHDRMFLSVWASCWPLWARIPANFKLHLYQVLKVESSSFPSAVFSHLLPRKCPSYTMCVCVCVCVCARARLHVLHWWCRIQWHLCWGCICGRSRDSLSRREGVCSFKGPCQGQVFPGAASGKEPACQCRRCKRCGFNQWIWKIWRRAWRPLPVIGQKRLAGFCWFCADGFLGDLPFSSPPRHGSPALSGLWEQKLVFQALQIQPSGYRGSTTERPVRHTPRGVQSEEQLGASEAELETHNQKGKCTSPFCLKAGSTLGILSCCCYSLAQSCPTPCDPMDCSIPGLPVPFRLLEITQVHFHWISDAIQTSHPLPCPLLLCLRSYPALGSFPMRVAQLLEWAWKLTFL